MLYFSRLEQYRENNRIEAKKALGGLRQQRSSGDHTLQPQQLPRAA